MPANLTIQPGQKLQNRNNPAEYVEYTGEWLQRGKNIFIMVRMPDGSEGKRLYDQFVPVEADSRDPMAQMARDCFGRIADLRRLLIFEKLKGTLNDVIYSMEAAQIDFYPHQFKPVLKFISSPTQRMLLADEVGLGKTIESGLIWLEMQARQKAKRLLVVCPPTLVEKWVSELGEKFMVDAQSADFSVLEKKVQDFTRNGDAERFALVCSYSSLRPGSRDREYLRRPPNPAEEAYLAPKARLLQKLRYWDNPDVTPFDLVIFDEAHYMRNAGTAAHLLGEALCGAARGVLCVSATPVNNHEDDLHSLLSLIDADFFGSRSTFAQLVATNRSTVLAGKYLSSTPVRFEELKTQLADMENNDYVRNSPLFRQLKKTVGEMAGQKPASPELVSRAQNLVEKLNLLGAYISRTQRRQVEENRPLRVPHVCTVTYTPLERAFYDSIERNIHAMCERGLSSFHKLGVITRQLMAASCLPAYATALLGGGGGTSQQRETLLELFGDVEEEGGSAPDSPAPALRSIPSPEKLAACDSKFARLLGIIGQYQGEGIVIFAYYRATLEYLKKRLTQRGMTVSMICGGDAMDRRWQEIERFTSGKSQIMLSSEVGSEGIDLQCAHVLINYDMPWNPMRIEQRIGRIDRVGQTSPKLDIFNFNIDDTIEQRVYERLHEKLDIFASTLGDIEDMLGDQVRQLTCDIFSSRMTREQEEQRIAQTTQALYNRMANMRELEERNLDLVGFSDYIQRKIEEAHGRGGYILPQELENYVKSFFDCHYTDTLIQPGMPADGCLSLRLTPEARSDLEDFIAGDNTVIARSLLHHPLHVTFDNSVMKRLSYKHRKSVVYINHQSPLIRWITSCYRDHGSSLSRTSALSASVQDLAEGSYIFSIMLFQIRGIVPYRKLAYGIRNIDTGETLPFHTSEKIFKEVLAGSSDWVYHHDIPYPVIREHMKQLDAELDDYFYDEVDQYQAENETMFTIREQRIRNLYLPRIRVFTESLESLKTRIACCRLEQNELEAQKQEKTLPLFRGRISRAEDDMNKHLASLKKKSIVDPESGSIARGIFRNKFRA
ncbi:MAG: SNF2-related protein [Desulfovibrionaceae bacterium]|nr:SNF2-related protein [Desulfovibrionaceae bacterium]